MAASPRTPAHAQVAREIHTELGRHLSAALGEQKIAGTSMNGAVALESGLMHNPIQHRLGRGGLRLAARSKHWLDFITPPSRSVLSQRRRASPSPHRDLRAHPQTGPYPGHLTLFFSAVTRRLEGFLVRRAHTPAIMMTKSASGAHVACCAGLTGPGGRAEFAHEPQVGIASKRGVACQRGTLKA